MHILIVASDARTHPNYLGLIMPPGCPFDLVDSGEEALTRLSASKTRNFVLVPPVQCRQLFNLVGDAVVVFDPLSYQVLTVNEKACQLYRAPR